jgi:hypothetical protein
LSIPSAYDDKYRNGQERMTYNSYNRGYFFIHLVFASFKGLEYEDIPDCIARNPRNVISDE